jgi:hypothetical protein
MVRAVRALADAKQREKPEVRASGDVGDKGGVARQCAAVQASDENGSYLYGSLNSAVIIMEPWKLTQYAHYNM